MKNVNNLLCTNSCYFNNYIYLCLMPIIHLKTNPMIHKMSIHIYYDDERVARQESFRTGCPFFISIVGGVRMFSIRQKVTV